MIGEDKIEKEIWKPIKGYEGLYEVSSLGRVCIFPDGSRTEPMCQQDLMNYLKRLEGFFWQMML